jgi:hypothetical protein
MILMAINKDNKFSFIACSAICIIIMICHLMLPFYNDYFFNKELTWDIMSYYLYLPLTFIYNDIGISDYSIIDAIFKEYSPSGTFYQAFKHENGNFVINYMSGFSILFSPFFFIGHLWALLSSYPEDGFSFPYQFCVSNGVYLYIFAGIFSFRKLMLRFFSDGTTVLIIIFLLLGTNYFNEAVRAHLMPHAILFAIVAFLINTTIDWYEKPGKFNSIKMGAFFTLAVLCRPSEFLLLIFIVLYGVYNRSGVIAWLTFLKKNIPMIGLALFTAFLICIPQLLYWKAVTGKFIFFSYQNTEGFNFLEPHIAESLFSFKNSWFIYTPLIIFPLLGLIPTYRRRRDLFVPVFTFLIINFYILSSWLAWWNGGGLGMRYFVESYVLLGIPFGFFLESLKIRIRFLKYITFALMSAFLLLNLFQTWQSANYIMPHDQRNFNFYVANFFATSVKEENTRLLDVQREYITNEVLKNESDYEEKTIGYFNFENVNTTPYKTEYRDSLYSFTPPYSFRLDRNNPFSPGVKIPFGHVTSKDHVWIRFSVKYFPVFSFEENPAALIITMEYGKRNFYYRSFELSDYPYELNKWNEISVDYLTPYPFSYKNEKIVAYLWLKGPKLLYIDEIQIKALERKW